MMSEGIVSSSNTENSVTPCEQSDVKRPTQMRCKLQPSNVVLEDVSKSKSGSVDSMRYRKRRKTRRGKSKRRMLKPYSRSWQDRGEQDDRESGKRASNVRAKMFASGQPVAPYNTTQFLMEDHNDLQNLDVKLKAVTTNNDSSNFPVFQRPSRARDSSLSVDSDEDYFYSSPEDEGDFLSKEFSNTYEDLHAERLNSMPKSQLIQEYLQMEAKVDMLEKRLKKTSGEGKSDPHISFSIKSEDSLANDESRSMDTPQKVCALKQEIDKLFMENEQLRRENDRLKCSYLKDKSMRSESSIDSESDSTPSPCRPSDSDSSCSCSTSSNSESVDCSSSDDASMPEHHPSDTKHIEELNTKSPLKEENMEKESATNTCDTSAHLVRTTCTDNSDEMN